MLAERLAQSGPQYASAWNFGPAETDAKPVSWIADELVRLWGERASWTRDAAVHPKESNFLKLDASKARTSLGWRPALPLDQALLWIVEWWRAFQQGSNMRILTNSQIERYEAIAQN